jgi:nitroreductase
MSYRIARPASLPHVANPASGTIKILPTRRTSKTVRLLSDDQKPWARRVIRSRRRPLFGVCPSRRIHDGPVDYHTPLSYRGCMDLFDVIHSVRAQRKFLSEPVPDSMISQLLDAAIRAPSAGNRQEWLFVIVQDFEQRGKIAAIYEKASVAIMGFYRQRGKPAHLTELQYERLLESGKYLHHHMDQAPVLLLACMRTAPVVIPPEAKALDESAIVKQIERTRAASIYPAVQNLILACRALGLGTVPTTNHLLYEDEVKAVLGLPQEGRDLCADADRLSRGKIRPGPPQTD